MFILRQVHKSGTQLNFIIGTSYHVSFSAKQYFPEIKEDRACLIGDGDFKHLLSSDFDYYIMTGSGKTFEKIFIPVEKHEILKKSGNLSEQDVINTLDEMAMQSLDPDTFEKWECVKSVLAVTRKQLDISDMTRHILLTQSEFAEVWDLISVQKGEISEALKSVKDKVDRHFGD